VRRVEVQALRLAIRSASAAYVGPLVPVEAQPPKIPNDARVRFCGRALSVRIFDAKDERSVVTASQQPVEDGGAYVSDVQLSRGAWRKTKTHYACLICAMACTTMPSPRPAASMPSLVLPLTLTRSTSMPIAAASDARMLST